MAEAESPAASMRAEELDRYRPTVAPGQAAIGDRAHGYGMAVFRWLEARGDDRTRAPDGSIAVVSEFRVFIPAKVHRALLMLPGDDEHEPSHQDGSAKIALFAIEESQAAWRILAERAMASEADAVQFIEDLAWLARTRASACPPVRVSAVRRARRGRGTDR